MNQLSTAPPGPSLSGLGREQASDLAASLAKRTLHAVYTSPLTRAVETGRAIAQRHGLPVVVAGQLAELSVGRLEGRSDKAAFEELDLSWHRWLVDGDLDRRAGPGGESARSVIARFDECVRRIAADHEGQTVVIVSHASILELCLPRLCGNLPPKFARENSLRNAQRVEVEVTDAFVCAQWGDLTPPSNEAE